MHVIDGGPAGKGGSLPPAGSAQARRDFARRVFAWARTVAASGGSLLYLLSALSLLVGLGWIVAPILAESYEPGELFPALGVLYVYELGLLGAALVVVLWGRVIDDAVSLLVLLAAFLGIGGLALETVAHDSIVLVLGLGLVLLVLGGGKLWAVRRWLAPGMRRTLLGVSIALLAYGYLAPAALAGLTSRVGVGGLRPAWLAGWWILILAGAVLYVAGELCPPGDARRSAEAGGEAEGSEASRVPFARTRGMGWIFVAVLLAAAALHQLGLAHLFGRGGEPEGFPWSWADLVPFASLALLLAVQYRRVFGCAWGRWDEALSALPALGIALALGIAGPGGLPGLDAELFRHPAVMSAVIGAAVAWKAWRLGRHVPWAVAILYAGLAVLSLGPPAGEDPAGLFWLPAGILVAAGCALMALLTRRVEWAVAAAAVVGASLLASPAVRTAAWEHEVHPLALAAVAEGVALCAVHLAFPRAIPLALGRLAPVLFAAGSAWLFWGRSPALEVGLTLPPAVLMGTLVWWRGRDRVATGLYAGAPLWQGCRLMRASFGWGCVLLAFLLLAAGVVMSLRKGARARRRGAAA
jgi:hypothetical protein